MTRPIESSFKLPAVAWPPVDFGGCIAVLAARRQMVLLYGLPRREDYMLLHEMTGGLLLATVERPDLTEDERHSLATKRTSKAGRPHAVNDELALKIFREVEFITFSDKGRYRFEPPLRYLGKRFGVSFSTVRRLLFERSPWGGTWFDVIESGEIKCYTNRGAGIAYFPAQTIRELETENESPHR